MKKLYGIDSLQEWADCCRRVLLGIPGIVNSLNRDR